jgi:predicted PurR-regulated permease PerM
MILFVSPLKALGFVAYIIIIQQIDNNVIYPRIVGNSVGLPGIFVLASVTVGGSLFGAAGMFLSVPVCAVIYCLVEEYVENKEKVRVKNDIPYDFADDGD